ncbi:MAG TPA: rRNA maturation RNase YbeY [Candidatus Udaeobacter sp.]|nr:rRNA maturation RNase YbeY [Candidatus Udaeobacter sp.]
MIRSEIFLRNFQRKIRINVAELQTFATKALRCCLQLRKRQGTNLRKLNEIFIWLISDRRMASLHRKFMHQRGPTDVLTFQHGEIFISVETAKRQARAFGNSLTRELCLYIAHALLHLHGFDDRTPAAARKMEAMQNNIVDACGSHR